MGSQLEEEFLISSVIAEAALMGIRSQVAMIGLEPPLPSDMRASLQELGVSIKVFTQIQGLCGQLLLKHIVANYDIALKKMTRMKLHPEDTIRNECRNRLSRHMVPRNMLQQLVQDIVSDIQSASVTPVSGG